jgi:hypothetical protein
MPIPTGRDDEKRADIDFLARTEARETSHEVEFAKMSRPALEEIRANPRAGDQNRSGASSFDVSGHYRRRLLAVYEPLKNFAVGPPVKGVLLKNESVH